jgi:hypothetical protein
MPLRIANAAGFLGDQLDAPRRLVEAAEVDYLTLEYLAELTLSILARQREKDPQAGYAADFLDVLESLVPALAAQPQLRIVTNGGGMNPEACARRAAAILTRAGLGETQIGVVIGDDLLGRLDELQAAGCDFAHLDTGQPLSQLGAEVVSANAYLGAAPIAEALARQARIVITGRVADASLTVGPAAHEFGWKWDDWPRLAAATVAGHLIECGAQVTGGYATAWREVDLAEVGYPIAEISESGECVITKPPGSGGVVNRRTVVEQLVYEIGDPRRYLTPDVIADFTAVEVEDLGGDRVAVRGAKGLPAPEMYKVSLAYRAGYTASGQLLVYGDDCRAKADACAEIIFRRLALAGFEYEQTHVEHLGAGEAAGRPFDPAAAERQREVVLRISVADSRREAVERFTKEIAPLATSGPAGLAGYAAGRSPVRPVFAYWPALVPKTAVSPKLKVATAEAWSTSEPAPSQ